jgi:hypothetical protein
VQNSYDFAKALCTTKDGTVIVTGMSGVSNLSAYYNIATVAYSRTGDRLWTNSFDGPLANDDRPVAITSDSSGNIILSGETWSGVLCYYQFVTIKFSPQPPQIPLDFHLYGNQLVLSWTNAAYALQSAPSVVGVFTNVPGAISPWTNTSTEMLKFFRLKSY